MTMCIHWPSVITGRLIYEDEIERERLDISLWTIGSEKDSHGSDVGVPRLIRIDPFERAITR